MDYFLQQLINGISLGAIYGLIAIGYTMVYGVVGMINFAHGDIYMIGAFVGLVGFLILSALGITFVPLAILMVLALSVGFTAAYGWTVERIAYRPLRSSPRLAPLISAIGVSIFLENYVQLAQGARAKPLAPVVNGAITLDPSGAVTVSVLQLLIVALTLALMAGLSFLVRTTDLGRSMRAVEEDRTMAALLGVDIDETISLTFVIGAGLAAIAGVLVMLYYGVIDFYIGFIAGIKAFTAAVLGGIGSIAGAMLGGLLIGIVEAMWSGYFSIAYKDVAVFAILVLVLILRPSGLLGRPSVVKV
ncbi:MAG TPA: branched-chain amino acid ABC transporter permease LivH [Micropepsaceae bacterium]|nr:branched-chain amino acid ABC transporter permease LivH [Micropepsaceae bacterium]